MTVHCNCAPFAHTFLHLHFEEVFAGDFCDEAVAGFVLSRVQLLLVKLRSQQRNETRQLLGLLRGKLEDMKGSTL